MGRSLPAIRPARDSDAAFIAAIPWPRSVAPITAAGSISFLIGNDAAELSYARAGFAFAEEKRDPAFEAITGSPGFRRFTRPLQ